MAARLYHYAGCSTCRKARALLHRLGVEHQLVDLSTCPPDAETIADLVRRSGLPLGRFFNTSGQSYRAGGWGTRRAQTSEAEQRAALAEDGMLIKRPILVLPDTVLVGFREVDWEAALTP